MGVYSNLAAEVAADIIPVKESVHPIQFAIDSYRSDLQLFEAMIERDFAEAYCESGIVSITEEEMATVNDAAKKGIITKIKEAIKKAIDVIVGLANSFANAVLKIAKADQALYKKFASYVTAEKLKDCPIKGKTIDYDKQKENSVSKIEKEKKIAEFLNKIDNSTEDTLKDNVEECINFIKEVNEHNKSCNIDNIINDKDEPIINKIGNNLSDLVDTIKTGYRKYSKHIAEEKNSSIKNLKEMEKMVSKQMKETEDKFELAKLNARYTVINEVIRSTNIAYNCQKSLTQKIISVERSNFVALGNWAMKNAGVKPENKEEVVNNSALVEECFILSELSEDFVESAFLTM